MRSPGQAVTVGCLIGGFASFLVSCGGESVKVVAVRSDSAGVMLVRNDVVSVLGSDSSSCAVVPRPSLMLGEAAGSGDGAQEFYRVFGAATLASGIVVVLDESSGELRFFDHDGTLIRRVGRTGDGPGEFRQAFGLWVGLADTLWVGNYSPWQLEVFGPSGEWVRSVRPQAAYPGPPDLIAVLRDGWSLLGDFASRWDSRPGYHESFIDLVLHDPQGGVADSVGRTSYGFWGMATPGFAFYRLFEAFPYIDSDGRNVVIAHGRDPEVRVHRRQGDTLRVARIIRFSTPDRSLDSRDVEGELARMEEKYFELADRSDPIPAADWRPALDGLRAGRDGSIWVRSFIGGNPPQPSWLVFAADGGFRCQIDSLRVDRVFEVSLDHVLGVSFDENGVERVVRHSVLPP